MDDRSRTWLERGSFSTWRAADREVQVFHLETGPLDAPLLLLVHGFPTSSIDWYDVVDPLAQRYRVAVLDFPGYGFSDKPRDWPYSITLDAQLLHHHVVDVLGADRCRVVAHDRGDSVALLLHDHVARGEIDDLTLDHLVLSDGNIFLPLASLTEFQKRVLDPSQWAAVRELVTPDALAAGIGTTTFTPPRGPDDPTIAALATTFAYADGTAVLHETIQYLRERAAHEVTWLESLAASDVPATVVWGVCDTVSPPRVATHVWERFLRTKPGSNELWLVPGANHYLQNDRPDAFVEAVTRSLERTGASAPGPVVNDPHAPVRVDHSSPRLPVATDTFLV
jgi:pimeloyl-ACP methyl ester carboxylesterase